LNSLRNDYDLLKSNLREYKKQAEKSHHYHHHHHQQHHSTSATGVASATAAAVNASTSPTSIRTAGGVHSLVLPASGGAALVNNQQIENESLEEDMRKAKESADMLRSVVLPLETEITTLRSRSNTSEMRIKELELLIDEVNFNNTILTYFIFFMASSIFLFLERKRKTILAGRRAKDNLRMFEQFH
jgi:hypothetical protein